MATSDKLTPPPRLIEIAIVGLPNAGKSTLLNVLLTKRLSAVSAKRNTTRKNLLGISSDAKTGVQLLFYDTPGFLHHKDHHSGTRDEARIVRPVMTSCREAVEQVDSVVLVVDAARRLEPPAVIPASTPTTVAARGTKRGEGQRTRLVRLFKEVAVAARRIEGTTPRFILVLNKCDLVKPRSDLLHITEELTALLEDAIKNAADESMRSMGNDGTLVAAASAPGEGLEPLPGVEVTIFMVSALKERGVEGLRAELVASAKPGDWLFDEEETTDLSAEGWVEECVREQLYNHLHQEVPYQLAQETREWRVDPATGVLHIGQDIISSSQSHHRIVLGPRGNTLRRIEEKAQSGVEAYLERPVKLKLWARLSRGSQ